MVQELDVGQLQACKGAAEAGDPDAQFALGLYYKKGRDRQELTESLRWLRAAAEQGHLNAQLALGKTYAAGEGLRMDIAEAVKWYGAQRVLGAMLYEGKGVDRDLGRAVKLWQAAAEAGDAYATFNLAFLHWRGQGVLKDRRKALRLVRVAAIDTAAFREIVGSLPRRLLISAVVVVALAVASGLLVRQCGGALPSR
jgi:uncharacterized protein